MLLREAVEGRLGVDEQLGQARAAAELAGRDLAELAAEGGQVRFGDLQPRRRGVAAVARQQLAALGEGGVQVEPRDAAGRADARLHAELVERDHDRGPVELVGEPSGDDADDAGMPVVVGQHERRVAGRIEPLAGLLLGAARGCSAPSTAVRD